MLRKIITFFAQVSRILVGVLFIISGFIKANDPLGFSYKLDEYFEVFGMPWLNFASLALAIGICAFEIGLGIALLLGAKMRFTAWSMLLMIVFFTFLTFYSWTFDVVKDCGCFGDALKLTPFQSFMKDVVLLVLILFIFARKDEIRPLFGNKASTALAYMGFTASLLFSLHCYWHLPVIDFRPYAVGLNIKEGMTLPPGAKTDSVVMKFIYEKDGKQMEFAMEDLGRIDDTYKFIDRRDVIIREGDKAKITDFSINSADGTGVTDDVLSMDKVFLLISYDLRKADTDVQSKVNDFAALCQKDGIEFIGITATSPGETDAFRHQHNSAFEYYYCDGTVLKTIVRSNPGLVLLRKGTVMGKWHHHDFPVYDEVKRSLLN